jgi:hypothetical protein
MTLAVAAAGPGHPLPFGVCRMTAHGQILPAASARNDPDDLQVF